MKFVHVNLNNYNLIIILKKRLYECRQCDSTVSCLFLTDEFQLVGPEKRVVHVSVGSELTVRCHLSPQVSADDMEIIWFKETNCVCLYKNKEVIEGRGYEGRVRLFNNKRGNISLLIKEFRKFDVGDYLCQVTCGGKTEEITVGVRGEHFISSFFISSVCSL